MAAMPGTVIMLRTSASSRAARRDNLQLSLRREQEADTSELEFDCRILLSHRATLYSVAQC